MRTPHEQLDIELALNHTNITSATTTTGNTIDLQGCDEVLLLITIGAFTVNLLTACNVQWFGSHESDMGSEAQFGSNVDIFSSIAANTQILLRLKAEQAKRFGRVKVVTTGAPTALNILAHAISLDNRRKPVKTAAEAAITLAGTIGS